MSLPRSERVDRSAGRHQRRHFIKVGILRSTSVGRLGKWHHAEKLSTGPVECGAAIETCPLLGRGLTPHRVEEVSTTLRQTCDGAMDEARPQTELGVKLKRLRQDMRLSIVAAAKATGVSKTHLWNLENRDVNPSRELLLKLASVYGVTVADLVNERADVAAEKPRMVAIFRDMKELSERDLNTVEALIKQLQSK